jgi:phosphate transport system permease protein
MVIATPIGLATAIYLSEYAKPRVRRVLKPAIEVLAGIPTIVYGFFV